MKKDERSEAAATEDGFFLSDQPVVGEERAASSRKGHLARESSDDLLYVVARDPRSLFLHWDLNWTRLFAGAGISARQVHLRIYRGDGSIESTQQINPFRCHCYADVSTAGTDYYCELGSFDRTEWKALVRSTPAATPDASMSEEFSAEFATLPAHLSFQRLLDAFGATTDLDRATLARSVAKLQETARLLKAGAASGDWSQMVTEIAGRLNGGSATATSAANGDLSTLAEMAQRRPASATPSGDELARLKDFAQRYGGSSWSGASHSGFGGSSPA